MKYWMYVALLGMVSISRTGNAFRFSSISWQLPLIPLSIVQVQEEGGVGVYPGNKAYMVFDATVLIPNGCTQLIAIPQMPIENGISVAATGARKIGRAGNVCTQVTRTQNVKYHFTTTFYRSEGDTLVRNLSIKGLGAFNVFIDLKDRTYYLEPK